MNSKKEKSLNDTYQRWVQTSLYDLPLDGANDFVDNKIMGYGTAIDEKVLSISDYRKLINRQREQAIGLEMNFEITPVFRSISNKEDSAIFVDEIKASIVLQVGNQELSLRMTTILEYVNNKWIVIHWHGSIPTETLAETDTWLVNEWKRKNEELEKLVDEKTFELLNKNRELEIEASLEKVRTIAMGMRKPDDMLDVCKTISLQLQSLGVKEIRNVQTAIFYEQRGTYMNYEYYAKHDKTFITETVYTDSEIHNEFAKNMIKGKGEVSTIHVNGSEVKDWIAYQKTTNVFIDKYLETASSLNYYWFSLGPVALGISTYHPLTETEINLFKRFLKVFELAYQRYLDIEQAETQAREAQIEASLERVRAVAMGMNKSDDLLSICDVSFKEFQKLGFENIRNAIIHIPNDEQKYFMDYDYSESTGGAITKIEYGSHPIVDEYLEKIKSAEDAYFEVVITEDQLAGWKEFRKNSGQVDDIRLDKANALSYYLFSIGIGDIGISTFEPIDESQIKILKRFRNVFDLAYQRYTDITQAEAQAREAKTEAALEKVRAIAMSMNKPDDLLNVCEVLFMEFHKLGFGEMRNAMINIHNDEKETFINYDYSDEIGKSINHLTYNIHPVIEKQIKQIRSTNDAFSETSFTGTDLEEWKKFRNKIGEKDDPRINNLSALYYYFYSIGTGSIGISTFSPIGEEKLVLLKRFRNVFSLSYQRYSDIALAEAQAKEAQIEAALERVRSRSMGMQKSVELKDVIRVVYEQFVRLKINVDHAGFVVDYTPKGDWHFWIADEQDIPSKITHPYFESVWANQFNEAKERGADFFATNLNFEEKNKFYNELLSYISGLPEASKDFYLSCPGLAATTVLFDNVSLYIENFSGVPYSDEENKILIRFGKVFQQTYTRFLDLQKAEAQAREAQIEGALERVRSKTIAMHNSNDVGDTVVALFDEVLKLGLDKSIRCGIGILEGNEKMETWSATSHANGKVDLKMGMLDMTIHHMLVGLKKAWGSGETRYSYDFIGDDVLRYYKALNNEPEYPFQADLESLPENEYHRSFFYSEGILFSFAPNPISDEAAEVLDRFARVFGQTYRRYLDLKKAEAQARESQIEASLERVRARTMAMHKSEELAETSAVLFKQMTELGVTPERITIGLIKEETKVFEVWSTDQEGIKINHHFNVSLDEPTSGKRIYEAWKEKKKSLIIDLSGQELNDWIHYVREVMGMTIKEELVKDHRIHSVAFFSHGMVLTTTPEPLPEESIHLLERFADVFNLTYRRFLDLKKAEAQAREAKIEASLERVRAKAMAMHSSDDLASTVDTFFSELNALNVMPHRCGVGIINPETRIVDVNATTATQENEIKKITGKLKLSGHPVLDKIFENWILQNEYHPVLRGKEILEYYQVMNPQVQFPDFANDETQFGYYFFFKEGGVFGWTEKELTESDLKIFRRFTSVLSLTYRRYLDLKESEARALEAIKESSLDRVRAEIASMRSTEDLNRITPIIWRELKILEVPFFRCGVFIVDEEKSKVQVYLTTPDGKSLGVLNLPFDSNNLTSSTVEFWRRKEVYKEHWNKEEFVSWSKSMLESGQIKNQQEYQGAEKPPDSLDLHFIPFDQGMLYVGNKEPLVSEKIDLVKSLAETFSIAYARYEDFDRLETAKKEVESAFGELDLLSKELKIKNEELEYENQRKALELEEARQLQLSMLPKELPQLPKLDIAVYMKTATEVGGDYYDFHIQSNGNLNILIGDATGHGMKSGMMVSIMKSFFIANRNNISLRQFFDDSNDSIKNMQLGRLMMALMGVQITSTKVIATNAGMPSLVYFRNKSQKAGEFVINNFPLGAMKGTKYLLKEIVYEKGDTLLLMSDGFAELKNKNNQQYGYPRIIEEFRSVAHKNSDAIVEHLKNSALQWINEIEPDDDVTFVVIKVR